VTVRQRGPGGDGGAGGQEGDDGVLMTEVERDGVVPRRGGEGQANDTILGRGDGMEAVGVAAAWTQQRRRGREKFSQSDGVQVKILQLGFKDRATGIL
jgi:hypothetical protein